MALFGLSLHWLRAYHLIVPVVPALPIFGRVLLRETFFDLWDLWSISFVNDLPVIFELLLFLDRSLYLVGFLVTSFINKLLKSFACAFS